jgi:hypothetical protein
MPNHSYSTRRVVATTTLIIASFVLLQSGCFSKKVKTEAITGAPVRLALLPFNVPPDNKELRWTALAAPILMVKAGENAEGLDILPLWETMPVALNIAGTSRTFTQDSAATVASWLSAKWSTLGEISPTKTGISLIVDFMPARSNLVPFRYSKAGKLDIAGAGFYDAYSQFLRYLVAKPFARTRGNELAMTATKDLAEALDREYGWFVDAEPGKAQNVVANLMRTDARLAKSLFSPTLYPALTENK